MQKYYTKEALVRSNKEKNRSEMTAKEKRREVTQKQAGRNKVDRNEIEYSAEK